MKIIEQLNKLPIISGEYLVLPSIEKPFFIIPMTSNLAFKKAIRFIKPKNNYGWLKKLVLGYLPFVLIRSFFPTIKIATKITNATTRLILPWNQDFNNKFVIFNLGEPPSLIKIGFDYASRLIQNEHKVITKYYNEIFPNILKYKENEDFCILETSFYKGEHPTSLPDSIFDFFKEHYKDCKNVSVENHPYINNMVALINEKLDKSTYANTLKWISAFILEFKDRQIRISLMHGDCTVTNIISDDENAKLIDWEECIEDGIPIDITYFKFRQQIDNNKKWEVKDEIDFLVVLHYIYFQCRYDNMKRIDAIVLKHNFVCIER